MATDSDRLLAAGVPLTLRYQLTGAERTVTMRYGMRGLKLLEDRFGSVEGASDALKGLDAAKPRVEVLCSLITAALVGDELADPELLIDWLTMRDIAVYVKAIDDALLQALPEPRALPEGVPGNAVTAPGPSLGVVSMAASGDTATATTSSGA